MTVTIDDLTPKIEIIFKKLAAAMIKTGAKGRVLYITKDETLTKNYEVKTYTSPVGITDITGQLKTDVEDIFDNGVKKVILFETKTGIDDVADALKKQKFDWMFTDIEDEQDKVAALAVELKKFALCYNVAKDSQYVINFTTPSATLQDGATVEDVRLLPYAIGIMAGCPYSKSILYKEIDKYKDVELPETLAEATCFYKFDEDLECVKFANGYTSLKSTGADTPEDFKKITYAECAKRVDVDLKYAFKKSYQGKFKNTYVHQQLFYDACKYGYFNELVEAGILDGSYNNTIDTDVEAQRNMWLASGKKEAADWDDETVKNMTYQSYVIPQIKVKFLDAMEDFKATVIMA